jgi:hypothetical protein
MIAAVIREILVRYLDAWTAVALHGGRPATFLSNAPVEDSVAALRVFGEFGDRLAGRSRLTMRLAAPDDSTGEAWRDQLSTVHSELGAPAGLAIEVSTDPLPAPGGPAFVYATDGRVPELGRATEVLLVADTAVELGLPATVAVELVSSAQTRLVLFGTGNPKHLEKFKDELWSVDEFAGVRYRDPLDPGHTLVDISLAPDVGPLRRSLLRHLAEAGPQAVAELRRWTLDETIYRLADLNRLLTPLVSTGAVGRDPAKGRLTPETIIVPR